MAKKGLVIGVVALLLIGGGGFVGAAYMGVVKVPGITPKSKLQAANKLYGNKKEDPKIVAEKAAPPKPAPVAPKKPQAKPAPKPTHTVDPAAGNQRLADVWAAMETPKLVAMTKTWNDKDLAPVLALMDDEKTAEVLASIEPVRASKLSKAIQEESSKIPIRNP